MSSYRLTVLPSYRLTVLPSYRLTVLPSYRLSRKTFSKLNNDHEEDREKEMFSSTFHPLKTSRDYVKDGQTFRRLSVPMLSEAVQAELKRRHPQFVKEHENMRAERLRARDYKGYLNLFGRENRLRPFLKIERLLSDEQYWTYLNEVWCLLEISAPDQREWLRLFTSARPHRELLMTAAEHKCLAAMPETLTIHRGYAKGRARSGLSWTLSKHKAWEFAEYATSGGRRQHFCGHRAGGIGMIAIGKCWKADVLAYFDKEQEIVINPRNVFAMHSRPIA